MIFKLKDSISNSENFINTFTFRSDVSVEL